MKNKPMKQTIVPYFMVLNAPKFIEFTKEVFQSEILNVIKLEDAEGVVHAEMRIGESIVYFADTSHDGSFKPEEYGDIKNNGLVPIHMFIYVENVFETYEKAIRLGATSIIEVSEDQNDGLTAGFVDPFSNLWWIQSKN